MSCAALKIPRSLVVSSLGCPEAERERLVGCTDCRKELAKKHPSARGPACSRRVGSARAETLSNGTPRKPSQQRALSRGVSARTLQDRRPACAAAPWRKRELRFGQRRRKFFLKGHCRPLRPFFLAARHAFDARNARGGKARGDSLRERQVLSAKFKLRREAPPAFPPRLATETERKVCRQRGHELGLSSRAESARLLHNWSPRPNLFAPRRREARGISVEVEAALRETEARLPRTAKENVSLFPNRSQ